MTHSQVNLKFPFLSIQAQTVASVTDSTLIETGSFLLISKVATGLIPGSCRGRSCIFYKDWKFFINRDHVLHLELSRDQVEYTLISMHQQEINSLIPFVYPSNEEIHQELLLSINVVKTITSSDVHSLDNTITSSE